MIKKILSHSFLYTIGSQIPRVVGIFILPLTTAHLTSEDYGISALLMTYTGAIVTLKDLGVSVLLLNYFFQRKITWPLLWRRIYGYIIAWLPIYILLQALVIYAALPHSQLHNYWKIVFLYSFSTLIFDIPIMFANRYLQYSQKPLPMAITSAIVGLIGIFVNLLTIVYFKMGYMGWIVSTFCTSFVSFLFYSYFTFYRLKLFPIFKYQFKNIISLLKISLPTIPHHYSFFLLDMSDRFLMNLYHVPIQHIGKYNLAYGFGAYFEFFNMSVGMAVEPFYTKIFSSDKINKHELARHLTFLLQSVFLTIALTAAIWIKDIFNILISNTELKSSYTIAVVIIMAYVYKPFYWSSIQLLIFNKRTNKLWRITLIGGILNVVLNLILIPFIGVWGAVWSTYVSLLFIGFYGGYIYEVKKLGRLNHYELYWLIAIFCLTLIAIILVELNYIYKILISIVMIVIISFIVKMKLNVIKKFNFEF
jgi:O-antigen/teichoic acid export membrane protein